MVVLRDIDGSEAHRSSTLYKMRALRVWSGCSFLFFTLNPLDHQHPLFVSYLNSQTQEVEKIDLRAPDRAINAFFQRALTDDKHFFQRMVVKYPCAAMRCVRFIMERTIDTLMNCSPPANKKPAQQHLDLIASNTEPGVWQHVAAYFGVIETTKSLREHLHMIVHLDPHFYARFYDIWRYIASICFHSEEAFARYCGSDDGLATLRQQPLMPITPKQKELLKDRADEAIAAQRQARGGSPFETSGPIPPSALRGCSQWQAWPAQFHVDPTVTGREWASRSIELSNTGALKFGNHICLPQVCYKRGKARYCRMQYWHWHEYRNSSDQLLARRRHGVPLHAHALPGEMPIHHCLPHRGQPALERTHPFHFKMTPAAMLANCCNHDLSVLFRFGDIAPDMPPSMHPLLLKDMIETITDHEYYVGGYLAKGGESTQGLLHCLHDAVLQHARGIAGREEDAADGIKNAQRLFRRLILALNKRHRMGCLDNFPLFFFTAGTEVVTAQPSCDGPLPWPVLLDESGALRRHPCYERRSTDDRYLQRSGTVKDTGGTYAVLLDPETKQPLRYYDHYRQLRLRKPWRVPELLGYIPRKASNEDGAEIHGRYGLFVMMLFRPWRNTREALARWSGLTTAAGISVTDVWHALSIEFERWRDALRESALQAMHLTAPPAYNSPAWWDALTYDKVRNFELTAIPKSSGSRRRPTDAAGNPLPTTQDSASDSSTDQDPDTSTRTAAPATSVSAATGPVSEPPCKDASFDIGGYKRCGDLAAGFFSHFVYSQENAMRCARGVEAQYARDCVDAAQCHDLGVSHVNILATVIPWNRNCILTPDALQRLHRQQQAFFAELDDAAAPSADMHEPHATKPGFPTTPSPTSPAEIALATYQQQTLYTPTCVIDAAVWLIQKGILQARALLLAALWLQRHVTQKHIAQDLMPADTWVPKLPAPINDNVMVVVGGAGAGKTYLLLVVESLFQHFLGCGCLRKGAPTNTASRLLGGNTLHALHRLPRGNLLDKRARLKAETLARHRKEWSEVTGHAADEVGMLSPKQLHQVNDRTQTARQSTLAFGGLWSWLSGDFLQLPPIGQPSLAQASSDICAPPGDNEDLPEHDPEHRALDVVTITPDEVSVVCLL
eukprot:s3817_g2.t1